MQIFFSVGEPSGDIHGGNLIRALRHRLPGALCVGYGGDRMLEAGAQLHYPLCNHAVMGITRVVAGAATFIKLIARANRYFREQRPDAVVLIDYPGFNWWIARRARAHGIPVFYFVPPQLWAWAGWRIKKMKKNVNHVLCSLPFEKDWYQQRGLDATYIGHPFFDDLPTQRLDADFMANQRTDGAPIIGILPGSRNEEIARNWSMQYRAAAKIHAARPDARFLVACFKPRQKETIDAYLQRHPPLPLQTCLGKTPEIIELSQACITVSGSVALELLGRGKPSVIVYRVNPLYKRISRWVVRVPHICLVNLLAKKELYPEFLTERCEGAAIAERVLGWLNDPAAYADVCREVAALRDRVAEPGACARAADYILNALAQPRRARAA